MNKWKIPFWNDCTGCEAELARTRAELADSQAEVAKLGEDIGELMTALHKAWAEIRGAPVKPVQRAKSSTPAMSAAAFWRARGLAIEAAGVDWWKSRESVWVTVPGKWRTMVTERGTRLRWNMDQRMPAARWWAGGVWPAGLVAPSCEAVATDWDRVEAEIAEVVRVQVERDKTVRLVVAADSIEEPEEVEADAEVITRDIPVRSIPASWLEAVRAPYVSMLSEDEISEMEEAA